MDRELAFFNRGKIQACQTIIQKLSKCHENNDEIYKPLRDAFFALNRADAALKIDLTVNSKNTTDIAKQLTVEHASCPSFNSCRNGRKNDKCFEGHPLQCFV